MNGMAGNKKILIVDDQEINRIILKNILVRESFEILEAGDGADALEQLAVHGEAIALLLLDIVMSPVDGYEVMKKMASEGLIGKIPVVVITADETQECKNRVCVMGAAKFIHKPFSPAEVRAIVDGILRDGADDGL
ncbi:MAG: response regulator [Cloacibacillus porcorum]|uniref:response regulator n=1 Tax=Cloacibacillus porcorum TaxID=1197717 RepID=UPI0023F18E8F|nr:response regulator [Cloacibacillus porcorum]MCD7876599.1 response regulator [Cloacibacillus porcorum]